MIQKEPTIQQCLSVVRQLNQGKSFSEEELKHKANLLYLLNRLSFWNDIAILIEFINYEKENFPKK